MAKSRSTRKGGKGLFRRVLSPIEHLLEASRNIGRSAFKRTGRVLNNGLGFVSNVTKSVGKHANKTVSNITRRKTRKQTRRNRK